MYRVLYWIGTGETMHCGLRRLDIGAAIMLRRDYIERGYSACLVSARFACKDAEAGHAPEVRDYAAA